MTRTERAAFPRAVAKDRHDSRTGLDKHIPKNGTGGHNWGNPALEYDLEAAGAEDEGLDLESTTAGEELHYKTGVEKRAERASLTQEERENALKFRKNAFKGDGVDLAAIARTSSAVSTSPPRDTIAIASDAPTAVKV